MTLPFPFKTPTDSPDFHLVHSTAARDLGVAIVSGRYKPGERVPTEMENAEHLHISRSAYREATRMLMAKGLLISRKRAGTVVAPKNHWNLLDPDILAWFFEATPSEAFINDLFELRMVVEPAAAALAARRRTEAQLDGMEEALATMRTATLATEAGRIADRHFHDLILSATGNDALISLSSGIGAAIRWTTVFKQRERALPRDPIPDHYRLFEAIRLKDPEAARSAASTLLLLALEDTQVSMAGI